MNNKSTKKALTKLERNTYSNLLREQNALQALMTTSKPPQKRRRARRNRQPRQSEQTVGIAQSKTLKATNPSISTQGDITKIVHRELIRMVANPGAGFNVVDRLRLNPASSHTFPWLGNIAPSWETYRWKKLKFICVPRCPTTTSGTMYLSPDYDAADQAATTEDEVGANKDTKEAAPWQNLTIDLNPARMYALYKQHTTASDARFSASSQDPKTMDPGFLSVCTEGDALLAFCKLYVEYEVHLMTPQFVTSAPEGGAYIQKLTGINNTTPLFADNGFATQVQEVEQIASLLPSSSFPGNNLMMFNKDWEGFLNLILQGTGITATGDLTKNGAVLDTSPGLGIVGAGGTSGSNSFWGQFKQGDLLGWKSPTGTTFTDFAINMGGASYTSILEASQKNKIFSSKKSLISSKLSSC